MIRVLHIIPDLGIGGAERMVVHLMRYTDRATFNVSVISLFGERENDLITALREAHIDPVYLGKKLGPDLRMTSRLYAAVRDAQPDVIHTHRYVLPYALPAIVSQRRAAKLHTLHSIASREGTRMQRAIQHIAFRLGVAPVAIAQKVAESVREVYGIPPRACIENGIPVEEYVQSKTAGLLWRQERGFSDADFLVVYVGRLSPEKNTELLVQAFANGPARAGQAHLLIVGDGPSRSILQDAVDDLGVERRVHFLGHRSDVPSVLAAADVFALSSKWEGNPLAILEAMAASKAVIATAVGGVPELIRHRDTGLLVPPGNVGLYAKGLVELMRDVRMRGEMGTRAALYAQRHFSAATMARRYESLYRELLAEL